MTYTPLKVLAFAALALALTACNDEEKPNQPAAVAKAVPTTNPQHAASAQVDQPVPAPATPAPAAKAEQPAPPPATEPAKTPEERAAAQQERKAAREERRMQREQWWTHEALADLSLSAAQLSTLEQQQADLREHKQQIREQLLTLNEKTQAAIKTGDFPTLRASLEQAKELEQQLYREQLDATEALFNQLDAEQIAWLSENPKAMRKLVQPVMREAGGSRRNKDGKMRQAAEGRQQRQEKQAR